MIDYNYINQLQLFLSEAFNLTHNQILVGGSATLFKHGYITKANRPDGLGDYDITLEIKRSNDCRLYRTTNEQVKTMLNKFNSSFNHNVHFPAKENCDDYPIDIKNTMLEFYYNHRKVNIFFSMEYDKEELNIFSTENGVNFQNPTISIEAKKRYVRTYLENLGENSDVLSKSVNKHMNDLITINEKKNVKK